MHVGNKLSALRVDKLKSPGRYGDGLGLWLQVAPAKAGVTKSWLFQFTAPGGRVRQLGLGPLHTVSLAKAREKARTARELLADGIDPIEARHAQRDHLRAEVARRLTFKEAGQKYIEAHRASWRNKKHANQWNSLISETKRGTKTYTPITAAINDLNIAEIDTALVLKVLEPIWRTKSETAKRARARIERILDWAKAHGHRNGENPARWKGHLDKLLPAPGKVKTVKHHPAMPYTEVASFMTELNARASTSARALEFIILTATRTSEVIGATWAEVDIANKVWVIPGSRMKARNEHRVPLSERAINILKALPREAGNPFLFIGGRKDRPLSNMAMLELLKGMRRGLTVHGFRSTFRDWAAESTSYPNHVMEMALAHTVGNAVEAAYRRGDLFEKRRRLMGEWARYCGQTSANSTVTLMRVRPKGSSL
jgi:integrase